MSRVDQGFKATAAKAREMITRIQDGISKMDQLQREEPDKGARQGMMSAIVHNLDMTVRLVERES